MATIPNERLPEFSQAIGGKFSIAELDMVCLQATNEGLFQNFAGQGKPVVETTLQLLKAVQNLGKERDVLSAIYCFKTDIKPLQVMIESVFPDVQLAVVEYRTKHVLSGLAVVKGHLSNPAVRAVISKSKDPLEKVARNVTYLGVYKNLHECMHQLQYKPYFELRLAAEGFANDRTSIRTLMEYRDQVRDTLTKARTNIKELPPDPIARQTELTWIEDLETASHDYNMSIDKRDSAGASDALFEIKSMLALGPARLNQQIFSTAKTLPLADLTAAFGAIGDVLGADNSDISSAKNSMRDLQPTIISRVAQHKGWQDADKFISALDDAFERKGNDIVLTFRQYWPKAKQQFNALMASESDSAWAKDCTKYTLDIDDQVTKDEFSDDLRLAFDAFRGSTRSQFFAVDANLKMECSELSRVSVPLLAILEAASHE
jgi:hypothetical protein